MSHRCQKINRGKELLNLKSHYHLLVMLDNLDSNVIDPVEMMEQIEVP